MDNYVHNAVHNMCIDRALAWASTYMGTVESLERGSATMAYLIGAPERVTAPVLVLAKILFWRPDRPWLLQTMAWQTDDMLPNFPKLSNYLDWWQATLDGKIFAVDVAHSRDGRPVEYRNVDKGVFRLQ